MGEGPAYVRAGEGDGESEETARGVATKELDFIDMGGAGAEESHQ